MQSTEVQAASMRARAPVVLLALLATLSLSCANKASTNQNNPPQNSTPVQVSATDLVRAYDNNIVAADYNFTDKLVSVAGVVSYVGRDSDSIVVTLEAGGSPGYITCRFNNDRFEDVVPLNKGESATIKGVCRGIKYGIIVLEDCFVSSTSKPQPTQRAALPPIQASPASPAKSTFGATARCRDGTLSYSQHHQGTCSHHGGVAEWLD